MNDYISREAANDTINETAYEYEDDKALTALYHAADRLNDLPAADVVEVVRCRDCLYFTKTGQCDRWADGTAMFYDDYCSRAAPKDGGQDDV